MSGGRYSQWFTKLPNHQALGKCWTSGMRCITLDFDRQELFYSNTSKGRAREEPIRFCDIVQASGALTFPGSDYVKMAAVVVQPEYVFAIDLKGGTTCKLVARHAADSEHWVELLSSAAALGCAKASATAASQAEPDAITICLEAQSDLVRTPSLSALGAPLSPLLQFKKQVELQQEARQQSEQENEQREKEREHELEAAIAASVAAAQRKKEAKESGALNLVSKVAERDDEKVMDAVLGRVAYDDATVRKAEKLVEDASPPSTACGSSIVAESFYFDADDQWEASGVGSDDDRPLACHRHDGRQDVACDCSDSIQRSNAEQGERHRRAVPVVKSTASSATRSQSLCSPLSPKPCKVNKTGKGAGYLAKWQQRNDARVKADLALLPNSVHARLSRSCATLPSAKRMSTEERIQTDLALLQQPPTQRVVESFFSVAIAHDSVS